MYARDALTARGGVTGRRGERWREERRGERGTERVRLYARRVLLSAFGEGVEIADDISFDIAAPALFLYFSSRRGAPENKLFNLY